MEKLITRIGRDTYTFKYKKNTQILNSSEYEEVKNDIKDLGLANIFNI